MYQTLKINKSLLEELTTARHFQFEKGSLKVSNPSACIDYLLLLDGRRTDQNPLLDKEIHSGNVLRILESAIELKDQRNMTYCSLFLQTLVTASNQDDFLALAKKYDLKELETFIFEKKFESPQQTKPIHVGCKIEHGPSIWF